MSKKYIKDFIVKRNIHLNDDYYVLDVECKEPFEYIAAGQFVEVKVESAPNTFLRRPISIHDVDYKANTISLLIQIVGEGTNVLSALKQGDTVNMVYPLGKGFSLDAKKVLLIGGGCGVAPLLYLAKEFKQKGSSVSVLLGGRRDYDILRKEEYEKYADVFVTTEDQSMGEKGYVTQHSIWDNISDYDGIFTCGPEAMMKAVATKAKENNIFCEVSLENTMACGIGACLCCVTETTSGNRCVCMDGPVFNINELKWQI